MNENNNDLVTEDDSTSNESFSLCSPITAEALRKKIPSISKDILDKSADIESSGGGCLCVVYDDGTFLIPKEIEFSFDRWMKAAADIGKLCDRSTWHYVSAPLSLVRREKERAFNLSRTEVKKGSSKRTPAKTGVITELYSVISSFYAIGASDIHIRLDGVDALMFGRVHGVVDTTPTRKNHKQVLEMIASAINFDGDDYSNDNFHPDRPGSTKLDDVIVTRNDKTTAVSVRIQYRSLVSGDDGQKVCVLRILGSGAVRTIEELGLPERTQHVLKSAMKSSSGMILITGATGAGKSTTLHACIDAKPPEAVVQTIEDPVEVESTDPLVFQGNATYDADEIKELVRLDPDIGVSGEIRDARTASEAFNMARTGHLMLATFHANSCLSALGRLKSNSFGISLEELAEDELLKMLVAQRLVPTLCRSCSRKMPSKEEASKRKRGHALQQWKDWELTATKQALVRLDDIAKKGNLRIRNPNGCSRCENMGINGRQLVLEYVMIDDLARQYIRSNRLDELKQSLLDRNWQPMSVQGWELIEQGISDPNMVEAVVQNVVVDSSVPWEY